jgi:hypothetical protein
MSFRVFRIHPVFGAAVFVGYVDHAPSSRHVDKIHTGIYRAFAAPDLEDLIVLDRITRDKGDIVLALIRTGLCLSIVRKIIVLLDELHCRVMKLQLKNDRNLPDVHKGILQITVSFP